MKLPVGVYAVSQAFAEAEGVVRFSFRDQCYEAEMGVSAFCYLEELKEAALQLPEVPFCGYGDTPVVLLPAGLYKAGTVKESRFRTYMPCAITLLGENAGISPNETDLRTAAARREETVVKGFFYFGCIAMADPVEGTLTLDGLTLESVKLFDERRETQNAGLTVKNCRFTGGLSYDLIRVFPCAYPRSARVENCRVDGYDPYFGEGRLLGMESGSLTVEGLYFAHTEKFPGLNNYSHTIENQLDSATFRHCLFENCGCAQGLVVQLPETSAASLLLEDCRFADFAREDTAALLVKLPETAALTVRRCRFSGTHSAPAILIDGCPDAVTVSDSAQEGYTAPNRKP